MATSVRKKPSKRVRLAKALRAEMTPFMRSNGFDHPPRDEWPPSVSFPRADSWVRVKDGREHGLNLDWDDHAPRFYVEWYSEKLDRELGLCAVFSLDHSPRVIPGMRRARFGGWTWSIPRTVRLAMRTIGELVTYLDGGPRSANINTDEPNFLGRQTPGYDEARREFFSGENARYSREELVAWRQQWRAERIEAFEREDAAVARAAAERSHGR
jgi:hypothetical protein